MNSREKGRNGDKDRLPFSREGRGPRFTGKLHDCHPPPKVIISHLLLAPSPNLEPSSDLHTHLPKVAFVFSSSRAHYLIFLSSQQPCARPGLLSL